LELAAGPWHTLSKDLCREISSADQLRGYFCIQTQQHQYQHILSPAMNSIQKIFNMTIFNKDSALPAPLWLVINEKSEGKLQQAS
jgi:hypothetical protein